jgi:membrane protease YdiL (CAAX protease family)
MVQELESPRGEPMRDEEMSMVSPEFMNYTISRKRAVAWIVATIIGPLFFYWFSSGWYIGMWYARTKHQGPPTPKIMIEAMFIGLPPALWAAVALWWWLNREKARFRSLFLTESRGLVPDIGIGMGLGVLWITVYGLMDVVSWQKMFTLGSAKLISVPASLSAGFCEEFLYRGFLFSVLAAAGAGKASRLVIASIAFGLAHCYWGPWGMAWTTMLGFTFALVVLWRGNVWPAILAHTLLDLCIEPGLLEKALTGGF